MVIIKKTKKTKGNNINNKTKHNIIKHKKLNKNKSKYKNNIKKHKRIIQKGGERFAPNIDEFIKLINEEPELDIDTAEKLTINTYNHYYSLMIQQLPCSIRVRDSISQSEGHGTPDNRFVKFTFNKSLEKLSQEYIQNLEHEGVWGEHDIIQCNSTDKGYELNIFLPIPENGCETLVQLIYMRPKNKLKGSSCHALVLLINNKDKTFSVIDSNGGGTKGNNNLDDNILTKLLSQVITNYKHKPVILPPCQLKSYRFPGSCVVWSQLYIELILRFGLKNATDYLVIINKEMSTHNIILKYANYVNKCLQNMEHFIKDQYIVKANAFFRIIWDLYHKFIDIPKKKNSILYLTFNSIAVILDYGKGKWTVGQKIYNMGIWNKDTKIYENSRWNTYEITSVNYDEQLLATLIKNDKNTFDKLFILLNSVDVISKFK